MPIVAERVSDRILESSSTFPVDMKGRYLISAPSSFGTVPIATGEGVSEVLTRIEGLFTSVYAGYTGVVYNPLLSSADDIFDSTASFPDPNGALSERAIRGDSPNLFGVQALNDSPPNNLDAVGYSDPGMLITDEIDIGALTNGIGTQNVLVWWQAVTKDFTYDKSPIQGLREDVNDPARLIYTEADPSLLKVYISADNGGSYSELTNLYPHSFNVPETGIRLAFRNDGLQDVYILAYGIMY